MLHYFPLPIYSEYPSLFFIIEHGLEGGLVGGLCDWFAVWKTYNAIETDSNKVAIEIGKWVSKDLLNQNTLRAQLNRIIEIPENQKEIIANKSINVTTDATSDIKYPSVRAVKSYVDLQFSNFEKSVLFSVIIFYFYFLFH
jgi:uncharacterized membrane-anchored protein YjiN (DUF445 family)